MCKKINEKKYSSYNFSGFRNMNILNKVFVNGIIGAAIIAGAGSAMAKGGKSMPVKVDDVSTTTVDASTADDGVLDYNERIHLIFMREEEKLARDVYTKLGSMYPDSVIFGNIDDSEQRHTTAVKAIIEKYGYKDPNTNDNIGVYTGEDYGWYFTEKYNLLVERASISELEALYVGAFIEELDMMDINQCPKVIVEADNGISEVTKCGKIATDNSDIVRLYDSLLDGSDSHLEGYVKNIEKYIGQGNYQAQVLSQEQVDEILNH
jgi:hypothetical protein